MQLVFPKHRPYILPICVLELFVVTLKTFELEFLKYELSPVGPPSPARLCTRVNKINENRIYITNSRVNEL